MGPFRDKRGDDQEISGFISYFYYHKLKIQSQQRDGELNINDSYLFDFTIDKTEFVSGTSI